MKESRHANRAHSRTHTGVLPIQAERVFLPRPQWRPLQKESKEKTENNVQLLTFKIGFFFPTEAINLKANCVKK